MGWISSGMWEYQKEWIPAKDQLWNGEGREEGINKVEVSSHTRKKPEARPGQEAKVTVGFQGEKKTQEEWVNSLPRTAFKGIKIYLQGKNYCYLHEFSGWDWYTKLPSPPHELTDCRLRLWIWNGKQSLESEMLEMHHAFYLSSLRN